jgi:hypothetical protein
MKLFLASIILFIMINVSVADCILPIERSKASHELMLDQRGEEHETLVVLSSDNNQTGTAAIAKKAAFECIPEESASACSNKTVSPSLVVGSLAGGVIYQAFLSFNISSIQEDSIIESVALDLRRCDVLGDPFLDLGCLKAYTVFYNAVSPEIYFSGLPAKELIRICSSDDLGNMRKTYPSLAKDLQYAVGSSRFQMRLQFENREANFLGIRDNDLGVLGGKGMSSERTEVAGEASGEWKPCLPAESESKGQDKKTAKGLVKFGTVRLLGYLHPSRNRRITNVYAYGNLLQEVAELFIERIRLKIQIRKRKTCGCRDSNPGYGLGKPMS